MRFLLFAVLSFGLSAQASHPVTKSTCENKVLAMAERYTFSAIGNEFKLKLLSSPVQLENDLYLVEYNLGRCVLSYKLKVDVRTDDATNCDVQHVDEERICD